MTNNFIVSSLYVKNIVTAVTEKNFFTNRVISPTFLVLLMHILYYHSYLTKYLFTLSSS